MPKKAVALFFFAAFVGAVIYVYFTFPRTKDEIPQSNNQRPFPSAPAAPSPNSVPVPETVPHPNPPKVPPGPTLRVMAWGSGAEAQALEAEADAFSAGTGRHVSLTIDPDETSYRADLHQAVASDSPPDLCLIAARDFSGLDPTRELADDAAPDPGISPRAVAAFTVEGHAKAVPDEFSVDVLFYNPAYFNQAGLGLPGRHWNWDILESISRAITSLKLKDAAGQPVYALEMPADFDLWNILCTDAGHPALDLGVWHLTDADTKDAQMRGLDLIQELFQEFTITAPLPKPGEPSGRFFAQQRSALLIGPSDLTASLPKFEYAFTLLPSDLARASLARVNGWAVTARSSQADAAHALAGYLAEQTVHAGWSPVRKPVNNDDTPGAICSEAFGQALIPRIEPNSAPLAQFLDQQIYLLARDGKQKTDALYAHIQTEYQNETSLDGGVSQAVAPKLSPKSEGTEQLRGL